MNQNSQAILQRIAALANAIQNQVNLGHPALPVQEVNLIWTIDFDGTGDPITWIEDFEKAANVNGFTDLWKLAVVSANLKEIAADWLRTRQTNNLTTPVTWIHADGANADQIAITFRQPFIDYFHDNARIARWQ